MEAFINGMACISHHNTISEDFFFGDSPVIPTSHFLFVTAPAYKDYIPAASLRRTSHVLKMGISAGLMCLGKDNASAPDAIVVGTAMGCYEDTDKFLRSIDDNDERMLTPTSFIQSTHNTVAGQIALLVKCHGYNFTYVHQNLSFEYALLDALMLLKEKETKNILVGGVDELIPPLCELFERAGHIKKLTDLDSPLWKSKTGGSVAGEGASFFSLSAARNAESIAKISGVQTIHRVKDSNDLVNQVNSFLTGLGLNAADISLVLSGVSGDVETDKILHGFTSTIATPVAGFKHLCGEYFTASAFALWFAAKMVQKKQVPAAAMIKGLRPENIEHILVVNQYRNQHYSLICIAPC